MLNMNEEHEVLKPLLEELRNTTMFRIAYRAKKHDKIIIRNGVWSPDTRAWVTQKDDLVFTYWDLDQNGYRTATNIKWFHGVTFPKEDMH